MSCSVDFHTHSIASPDGSLRCRSYERMLQNGLDYIAVTDHNTIAMALEVQKSLGEYIIVGEEITTTRGEIIGLYLQEAVPPGLSPVETINLIREQGGLVYIPHPFETVRRGIGAADLEEIASDVAIIEGYNGRAFFQNKTREALAWAQKHDVPVAASSDAHGAAGWGRTFTVLPRKPTRDNLTTLLRQASFYTRRPGIPGVLYPTFNRLRKRRHR